MSYQSHHQSGRYGLRFSDNSEILKVNGTVKDTYITNAVVPNPKKAFDPLSRTLEEIHDYEGYTGSVSVTDSVFTNIDNFVIQYLNQINEEVSEQVEIVTPAPDVLRRDDILRECIKGVNDTINDEIEAIDRDFEEKRREAEENENACFEKLKEEEEEESRRLYRQWEMEKSLEENWEDLGLRNDPRERIGEWYWRGNGQGNPDLIAPPPEGEGRPIDDNLECNEEIFRWRNKIANTRNKYACARAVCRLEHTKNLKIDPTQQALKKLQKEIERLQGIRSCSGEVLQNECPNRDAQWVKWCKLEQMIRLRETLQDLGLQNLKNRCDNSTKFRNCINEKTDKWFRNYPYPSAIGGAENDAWDTGEPPAGSEIAQENNFCVAIKQCRQQYEAQSDKNNQEFHRALKELVDNFKETVDLCDCDPNNDDFDFGPELLLLGWDPFKDLPGLTGEDGRDIDTEGLQRWGLPIEFFPRFSPPGDPRPDFPLEWSPWGIQNWNNERYYEPYRFEDNEGNPILDENGNEQYYYRPAEWQRDPFNQRELFPVRLKEWELKLWQWWERNIGRDNGTDGQQ